MPLQQPPRDGNGKIIPHDHDGLLPEDWVIRRISGQYIVDDPKEEGGKRISSMAFSPSNGPNGGMSVDIQKLIEEAGIDARTFVTTPVWIGSVRFKVGDLRGEELRVGFEPTRPNPFHGEVWGNFTKSRKERLKGICEWFEPIAEVSLG